MSDLAKRALVAYRNVSSMETIKLPDVAQSIRHLVAALEQMPVPSDSFGNPDFGNPEGDRLCLAIGELLCEVEGCAIPGELGFERFVTKDCGMEMRVAFVFMREFKQVRGAA